MSDTFHVTSIILAAGMSRRMGVENKLLKNWNGKPLIEHVCHAATRSRCQETIAVTGYQDERIVNVLREYDISFIVNSKYDTGVSSSIISGLNSINAPVVDAVLILLGDMPQITSCMMDELILTAKSKSPDRIIVSTSQGSRGNPVLWPKCYFDQLTKLRGDEGARQIFNRYEDKIVPVELGRAARFDLDTPDAFKSTANPSN